MRLPEEAMATLLNELTVARLLISGSTLQGVLDDVSRALKAVGTAVDQVDLLITREPVRQKAIESLKQGLHDFDIATQELYTAALDGLKPTVEEDKYRRRSVIGFRRQRLRLPQRASRCAEHFTPFLPQLSVDSSDISGSDEESDRARHTLVQLWHWHRVANLKVERPSLKPLPL